MNILKILAEDYAEKAFWAIIDDKETEAKEFDTAVEKANLNYTNKVYCMRKTKAIGFTNYSKFILVCQAV